MLPQLANETSARAPEPWCLRRRTCKAGAFSRGLWRAGTLLRTPVLIRAWGLHWDWLKRNPDSGERNAPSNEKSGNLSGNFLDPAQTFRSLEKEKSRQHIVLEGLFLIS